MSIDLQRELNVTRCNHVYKPGKALVNLATNGKTYDHDKIERGDGVFPGTKVRTIEVEKCEKCGDSHG